MVMGCPGGPITLSLKDLMTELTKLLLEVYKIREKRFRTSHHLAKEQYEKFKLFCKNRGISTSDVLNLLIKDFNVEHAEEIESVDKPVDNPVKDKKTYK